MTTSYTFTDANLNSADYRLSQRPTPLSTEQRIKLLRRYMEDRAEFAWMESYKQVQRELAELEAAA